MACVGCNPEERLWQTAVQLQHRFQRWPPILITSHDHRRNGDTAKTFEGGVEIVVVVAESPQTIEKLSHLGVAARTVLQIPRTPLCKLLHRRKGPQASTYLFGEAVGWRNQDQPFQPRWLLNRHVHENVSAGTAADRAYALKSKMVEQLADLIRDASGTPCVGKTCRVTVARKIRNDERIVATKRVSEPFPRRGRPHETVKEQ